MGRHSGTARTLRGTPAKDILEYLHGIGVVDEVVQAGAAETYVVPRDITVADPRAFSWLKAGRQVHVWSGAMLLTEGSRTPAVPITSMVVSCTQAKLAMAFVLHRFWGEAAKMPRIEIAETAKIRRGAVLGEPGQNFVRSGECLISFPHLGAVVIEDKVEIGPNATVCRGVLTDTTIKRGSKIGNGTNIGHGVYVGENVLVSAHCSLAGSVVVEDRAVLWQGVNVAQGVRIGEGAEIGVGSAVLHDVPPGEVWAGVPALRIRGPE